jgi:putative endonuclease|nr:GIY-YIG nuclease family protein [Candidatus Acidoferrales bacterium]
MREVFHVYTTASKSRVIYVGMTNDFARRVREHKEKDTQSFTNRFNVDRLVWFEEHGGPRSAIAREKQIKGWARAKKIALIETKNPQWKDLSIDF